MVKTMTLDSKIKHTWLWLLEKNTFGIHPRGVQIQTTDKFFFSSWHASGNHKIQFPVSFTDSSTSLTIFFYTWSQDQQESIHLNDQWVKEMDLLFPQENYRSLWGSYKLLTHCTWILFTPLLFSDIMLKQYIFNQGCQIIWLAQCSLFFIKQGYLTWTVCMNWSLVKSKGQSG